MIEKTIRTTLPGLPESAIKLLLTIAQIKKYGPQQMLFRQGNYSDILYIMVSGTVKVIAEVGNEMYEIDKIRYGCFGEIGLLLDQQRTASVVTEEETTVIEITREDFQALAKDYPQLTVEIAKIVIKRLIEQNKATTSTLRLSQTQEMDIHYITGEYLVINPVFGLPPLHKQYHGTQALMLMPFRDDLTPVYHDHIKPTAERLGLTIKRGDSFFTKNAIMNEIWAAINTARLIIADCTHQNANVFYELGIAHTLGKPSILITQNTDDIPFDLRTWRHIIYTPSDAGLVRLEHDLGAAIMQLLDLG